MHRSLRAPRRLPRAALVAVVGLVVALVGLVTAATSAVAAEPEWNIARVRGPGSAAGVTIAVVDSGVDATHPALIGRVRPQLNFVDDHDGDDNGHGTHVAGTAAGADAGCGNIGMAPDATILPVRVLADEDGEPGGQASGSTSGVAQGIRAAADAGAHVINLSLGGDVVIRQVAGSGIDDAIEYAWSKGSIPVLAAGNDGLIGGLLGSGYGGLEAVVVTATTHEDEVAPYATSIGSADWGISAPGGDGAPLEPGRDIASAYPQGQCALLAGTSMAAPHVAGALAVLRAGGFGQRAAVDRILETARDLGSEGTYGAGLLDLAAALGRGPTPSQPPTTAPPPPTTQASETSETSAPATTSAPTTAAPTSGSGGSTDGSSPSTAPTGSADDPSSTAGTPDPGTSDVETSGSSTTGATDGTVDDIAADVVVGDEDDGTPGWLAPAAGALILAVGGGALYVRRRS